MRIQFDAFRAKLPLPATDVWPEGVWDIEAFRQGDMSCVLFAPRGADYQTSHRQDELYVVLRGNGILSIEEAPLPFQEGDLLFVPAGKNHRFSEFSADLATWAIF